MLRRLCRGTEIMLECGKSKNICYMQPSAARDGAHGSGGPQATLEKMAETWEQLAQTRRKQLERQERGDAEPGPS